MKERFSQIPTAKSEILSEARDKLKKPWKILHFEVFLENESIDLWFFTKSYILLFWGVYFSVLPIDSNWLDKKLGYILKKKTKKTDDCARLSDCFWSFPLQIDISIDTRIIKSFQKLAWRKIPPVIARSSPNRVPIQIFCALFTRLYSISQRNWANFVKSRFLDDSVQPSKHTKIRFRV